MNLNKKLLSLLLVLTIVFSTKSIVYGKDIAPEYQQEISMQEKTGSETDFAEHIYTMESLDDYDDDDDDYYDDDYDDDDDDYYSDDTDLDPTGLTFEEWIVLNLKEKVDWIDVSYYNMSAKECKSAYFDVLYNHVELFYVEKSWYYYDDEICPYYDYNYMDDGIDTDKLGKAFKTKCNKIISGVKSSWSDFQKVLYIHDYIITHAEYDLTFSHYSAYDNIMKGTSVCDGYASAFSLFMHLLNIPCEKITSYENNHAWNAVKVDGSYYYIDVTFDDPILSMPKTDYCSHEYFLLTKKQMHDNDHIYTDWITEEGTNAYKTIKTGSSRKSGATSFIYSVYSAVTQSGKQMYYYDPYGSNNTIEVYKHNLSTGKTKFIYTYTDSKTVHYTGKTLSPSIEIYLNDGTKLSKSKYSITCSKTIKNVGKYTLMLSVDQYKPMKVKVKLIVKPPKTAIKTLSAKDKGFRLTWKKKTKQVDGYQLQYSLKSSFSNSKKVKVTSNKANAETVLNLKSGKTYYVRIRTYKKVGSKTYYSSWSAKKKVKTK